MYQFEEEINYESLFPFSQKWIENMNWAMLPKAAQTIFPIILSHANENGIAFPSERRIAILAGISDKTVREGLRKIDDFPGWKATTNRVTKGGKRGKCFHLNVPKPDKGLTYPFYRSVFYGGNWCQLTPSAQALYPVMRHFGMFDFDRYNEEMELETDASKFDEVYRERRFDFCEADPDVLIEYAGISRRSLHSALDSLEHGSLIEKRSRGEWKVFIRPTKRFEQAFLNKQILKRYRHEEAT